MANKLPRRDAALLRLSEKRLKQTETSRSTWKPKYQGFTHARGPWTKRQCVRGEHQWDEVWSIPNHYLSCDHCGVSVFIASVDYTYDKFAKERVARLKARKKRGYGP